jgi:hypothetical protein
LARWKGSGLSLSAFSRREELSYTTLLYWRRKLRKAEAKASAASETSESASPDWLPVRVVPESQAPDVGLVGFEVRLTNGMALGVPPRFDEGALRRLVTVLATC